MKYSNLLSNSNNNIEPLILSTLLGLVSLISIIGSIWIFPKLSGSNIIFYLDKNKIGIRNSRRDGEYKLKDICYFFYNNVYDAKLLLLLRDGQIIRYTSYRAEKFLDTLEKETDIELIIRDKEESSVNEILFDWKHKHEEFCNRHENHT